jgi:hypothetical protein
LLTGYENSLERLGLFASSELAIVGRGEIVEKLAGICSDRGVDRVRCEECDQVESDTIVLAGACGQQFQKVLYVAKPFSRIVVMGPVDDSLVDLDFYSTVHSKNLELSFVGLEVSGDTAEFNSAVA